MKVLTVVGRAGSQTEFERTLTSYLSEPFRIKAVVPLTADDEAKNFLAYIDPGPTEEVEDDSYDAQADHLRDGLYAVELHDGPGEAVEYVNEEYQGETYAPFSSPLTAKEIYRRDVFMGLAGASEIAMVRALFDGVPCVALVHAATGHGDNDNLMTPFAIMVDENIGRRLELPFKSSFEE